MSNKTFYALEIKSSNPSEDAQWNDKLHFSFNHQILINDHITFHNLEYKNELEIAFKTTLFKVINRSFIITEIEEFEDENDAVEYDGQFTLTIVPIYENV